MNNILTGPFILPKEEISINLSIKPGSKSEIVFERLLNQVEEIAKPKAMYRVVYIEERDKDTIAIDNAVFHSRTMAVNLNGINRVFPFLATCGTEVDEILLDDGDILGQYWLNTIKLSLLTYSEDHLFKTIQRRYGIDKLSAMNPGSGNETVWPIEEQKELFTVFGGTKSVEEAIGVCLLPSYLMTPDMSTSGLLFPSQVDYVNCQLCKREDCSSRRASFDSVMWDSIQS